MALLACDPPPPTEPGVSVARVPAGMERGEHSDLREGDLLLRNTVLGAVVGAAPPRPGQSDLRGTLLDIAPGRLDRDLLEALRTGIEVDGRRRRLRILDVRRIVRGRRPVVLVLAAAEEISLATEIGVGTSDQAITLRTTVTSGAVTDVEVRVVDDVSWADSPAFAPGLGEVTRWREATVPWFARADLSDGAPVAYAYVRPDGDVSARFEVSQAGSQRTFPRVVARLPGTRLRPGESRSFVRKLVVVRGELGDAARVAWRIRGRDVRTVRGTAPGLGAGGEVVALDAAGEPALVATVDEDARFALHLPAGRYALVARGFGRKPAPRVAIDVAAGAADFVALPSPEAPGRLEFAVTDAAGAASVPCRLVVRGYGETPDPDLGPPGSASGSAFVVHAAACVGSVTLPAGRYRVSASHGPEWTTTSTVLEVHPGDPARFEGSLEHAVPTPGWVSADLHVHSAPSPDSPVPLVDRVVSLVAEGVDVAVATDHNHVTDFGPTIARLGMRDRILGVPGDEVTTFAPSWGHFNVFPLAPAPWEPTEAVLPYAGVTPEAIFEAAREAPLTRQAPDAGTADAGPPPQDLGDLRVVQVNHPRGEEGIGYFDLAGFDARTGIADSEDWNAGFDLVEVWNGIWLGEPERLDAALEDQFAAWNLGMKWVATGNSDSHRLLYQWAGWPRNYVAVENDDVAALGPRAFVASLREGRVIVTNGPMVDLRVQGEGPGSTVHPADGAVEVSIVVRAAPWVDVDRVLVIQDGVVKETIAVGDDRRPQRLRTTRRYAIAADSWISVVVRGDDPAPDVYVFQRTTPVAFTNPVWIRLSAPP